MAFPPLHSFRVFESVPRLGSLAAAAIELHVTSGAVSQQVKALQAGLGVELFEKRGRQLVLTASWRALQKSVASALASAWRSATRRFHSATSTKAGWCVRRRSRWRQCTTTTWSAPRRSGNARRSGRSSSGCCRLVSSAQPGALWLG